MGTKENKLSDLLSKRGLSAGQVSIKLGRDRTVVSRYFSASTPMQFPVAGQVANILHTDLDTLYQRLYPDEEYSRNHESRENMNKEVREENLMEAVAEMQATAKEQVATDGRDITEDFCLGITPPGHVFRRETRQLLTQEVEPGYRTAVFGNDGQDAAVVLQKSILNSISEKTTPKKMLVMLSEAEERLIADIEAASKENNMQLVKVVEDPERISFDPFSFVDDITSARTLASAILEDDFNDRSGSGWLDTELAVLATAIFEAKDSHSFAAVRDALSDESFWGGHDFGSVSESTKKALQTALKAKIMPLIKEVGDADIKALVGEDDVVFLYIYSDEYVDASRKLFLYSVTSMLRRREDVSIFIDKAGNMLTFTPFFNIVNSQNKLMLGFEKFWQFKAIFHYDGWQPGVNSFDQIILCNMGDDDGAEYFSRKSAKQVILTKTVADETGEKLSEEVSAVKEPVVSVEDIKGLKDGEVITLTDPDPITPEKLRVFGIL